MRKTLVAALLAASVLAGVGQAVAGGTPPAPRTRYHYVANVKSMAWPAQVGFNVLDVHPWDLGSLPAGTQGLVWLGQKCPTPADDKFRATVTSLAQDPRVFGYYLSDEPYIVTCPGGPQALATRAEFIRQASGGHQVSVIAAYRSFHAFRPAVTKVSMVGIVAFPCSVAASPCDLRVISRRVAHALAAGIPRRVMVPVYQAFGQELTPIKYYRLPTRRQLRAILARWAALLPRPPMDYTYGWDHQFDSNPSLRDAAALRRVMSAVVLR